MADNRITINAEFGQNYKDLGFIGRVGENDSRKIVFDCADALTQFPGASIVCVIKRACDTKPYTAALTENKSSRILPLSAVENAVAGQIMIELRAVSNDTILKSAMFSGRISESLQGEGDRPGKPVRDVLDRVDATLAAAEETRSQLATALDGVDGAVSGANTAAENAQTVADTVQAKLDNGDFVGPAGKDGADGAPGKDGKDGATGPKGDTGATGPQGAPGADAPQIDDTAVTETNPWSSKQIIDTLCPAFEVSGNPVTCYPVANYPLDIVANWKPTQEGSGNASPDNIRPIVRKSSVTISRQEDNMEKVLTIPKTIYGGKVDVATGEMLETWKQYTTVDMTESNTFTFGGKLCFRFKSKNATNVMCDKLKVLKKWVPLEDYSIEMQPENYLNVVLYIPGLTTKEEYLQWLLENSITVITNALSDANISATGGGSIPAISGINTILTDADSVTVKGRADPLHTINALTDRVAALETAAANT